MVEAIKRTFQRIFASPEAKRTLRKTLVRAEAKMQQRTLVYWAVSPACEKVCRPLDGRVIRVGRGGIQGPIPPGDTHPRCDCSVRVQ